MAFNQKTKREIASDRAKRLQVEEGTGALKRPVGSSTKGSYPTTQDSVKVGKLGEILGVPSFYPVKAAKTDKPLSQDARQQAERLRQERAAGGEVMSPRKKGK